MRKLYPVSVSCGVLKVSASGYFNWLRRRDSGRGGPARRHSDEALLAHIRAVHAEVKGEYGWPRMQASLVKGALAMAWWRRRPPPGLIFHSDRGSPILQPRVPGNLERLGHAFIDEQEGQLLGHSI